MTSRPTVEIVRVEADGLREDSSVIGEIAPDMTGQHRTLRVRNAGDRAVALDLAMRGASLTLLVDHAPDDQGPDEAAFLDELRRVADVSDAAASTIDPVTVELLRHLAAGHSTAEAARRLHLSTRTAYRLLAEARAALGVETTAEALLAVRSGVVGT